MIFYEELGCSIYQFFFFWNIQFFFKQGVTKSKGIIEYPIEIVDVT